MANESVDVGIPEPKNVIILVVAAIGWGVDPILLMAEILHQFIGSLSHDL